MSVMVAAEGPSAAGHRRMARTEEARTIVGKRMLVTLHDLSSVAGGRALMCGFEEGGEGLLRLVGLPRDPQSLAEQRAYDDDLPVLMVTMDDIRTMLYGGTVMTYGLEGVLEVRVMTAEELMEAHRVACRETDTPTSLTWEKAHELTTTL